MKKLILILTLVSISFSVIAQESNQPSRSYPAEDYQVPTDLFEEELQQYYDARNGGEQLMLWSGITLIASTLAGSTFTTLYGLEIINKDLASPAILISYGGVTVSGIATLIGFFIWRENSDAYLDTLRLQSQYYNLVY